jgi:MerR HTH family regulatory protein
MTVVQDERTCSSEEVALMTHASYRSLDYWVRRGLLHPINAQGGSGTCRRWRRIDVRVAKALAAFPPSGKEAAFYDVISEAMYRVDQVEGAQFLAVFANPPSAQFVCGPVVMPKRPCWIYPLEQS